MSYIPSKSISRDAVQMHSPSCRPGNTETSPPFLSIEVVDPEFYTMVVNYSDATEAFSAQDQFTCAADSVSKRIIVSNPALLKDLVANFGEDTKEDAWFHAPSPTNRCLLYATQCLRSYPSYPSFMDTFVFQMLNDHSSQSIYASTVMQHWMVSRLSFGYYRLLRVYQILCATLLRLFILLTWAIDDNFSCWWHFPISICMIGAILYCVALIAVPL